MHSVNVCIIKIAGKITILNQLVTKLLLELKLVANESFSSGIIATQSNKWFAILLQEVNDPNNKKIGLKSYLYYYNINNIIYLGHMQQDIYSFSIGQQIETPHSQTSIWIAYQFIVIFLNQLNYFINQQQPNNTKTYKALECFSIRSIRKYVYDLTKLPTIYLELVSLNQIYTTIGNFNQLVNKSISTLFMAIKIKCLLGKQVQAQFNKCNSCSTKRLHIFHTIALIK